MVIMEVIVGQVYRHFLGKYYRVLFIASDSTTPKGESLKEVVVYEELDGKHRIWTRPIELFTEKVDKDIYPDCVQEYRFKLIEDYD